MKALRFAGALLTATVLTGCTNNSANLLIESASHCPQSLEVGQILTLRLASNPSTGYRWELLNAAPQILRSLGPEVFHDDKSQQLIGAPGHSVWRFAAYAQGESELLLSYKRPWEKQVGEEFQCRIHVR